EAPCPSSASATLKTGPRPQLPSPIASAVPTGCNLQSIASIRPISRIVVQRAILTSEAKDRLLSKLAYADEVQDAHGAQNLSGQTYSMVRAPEQRSNSLVEVEFRKKSNIKRFFTTIPPTGEEGMVNSSIIGAQNTEATPLPQEANIKLADALKFKAQKAFEIAKSTILQARNTPLETNEEAWTPAKEAVEISVEAYSQAIEAYKKALDNRGNDWILDSLLEHCEKMKTICATKLFWINIYKAEQAIAPAIKKARNAPPEINEEAWGAARESIEATVEAMTQIANVYKNLIDTATEEDKTFWNKELKNIEDEKVILKATFFWIEVLKAEKSIDYIIFVDHISDVTLLKTIEAIKVIEESCSQSVAIYQEVISKLEEDTKNWSNDLKQIEKKKKSWMYYSSIIIPLQKKVLLAMTKLLEASPETRAEARKELDEVLSLVKEACHQSGLKYKGMPFVCDHQGITFMTATPP
ncbi:MAG TPA: hypothetical protein VJK54_04460, partial [Chthoniobacterales bacterium]|nr:hypothetical protein [Chthoniobacterales bacterium]